MRRRKYKDAIPTGSNCIVLSKVIAKDYPALEALIASGANLDEITEEGYTPLGLALVLPDFKSIHLLIDGGANVNYVDKLGLTMMHIVVKMAESYISNSYTQEDVFELVKKLVDKGASMTYQDRRGNTPINVIAQRAKPSKSKMEIYTKLGKLLLYLDKDVSNTVQLRNNMGKSPLDYLAKNGNVALHDAVYEKLPHVQDKIKNELKAKELEAKKFLALDKELSR
jgi:ankyrin repeat protein